jgi:hypothetical protein
MSKDCTGAETGSLEVVSMRGNVITVDLWRAPLHELDYVVLNVDVPERFARRRCGHLDRRADRRSAL